jgi:hypothetical protein
MFPQAKYTLAKASGIPWLVNWSNRNRLLVLTYHGIYDGSHKMGSLPDTFIHVDDMARQLRAIKQRYRVIDPDELLTTLEAGTSLPPNAVLLTFDDGYESFYRLAAPVLDSLGVRALVFIPTHYIEHHKPFWFDVAWLFIKRSLPDQLVWLMDALGGECSNINRSVYSALLIDKMKRMLPESRGEIMDNMKHIMSVESENYTLNRLFYPIRNEQMKELADRGTTFGGHTHTHTILTVIPDSLAKREILENKNRLEKLLSRPCHFFAYPNGGEKDFNETHKMMLRRAGYKAAFSLTQKRSLIYEDAMDICRIHVAPEDTVTSLMFHCTGTMSVVERIRHYGKIDE